MGYFSYTTVATFSEPPTCLLYARGVRKVMQGCNSAFRHRGGAISCWLACRNGNKVSPRTLKAKLPPMYANADAGFLPFQSLSPCEM
ncbi:hypothetical protein CEXT_630551 [Caerostris extrusa]|uniref:Uncharacterized protein n=1 Tax=Caerostris extrusa TaxID=172846 RepID=A0AAV4W0Q8_CAEEX|nr:hypothetical protein CEXT_630551 [Caerostris extrusa]